MKRFRVFFLAFVLAVASVAFLPNVNRQATIRAADKKEVIVYITRTGSCYHRSGCRYLSKSKIQIELSKAKARGYRPCSKCRPPQ